MRVFCRFMLFVVLAAVAAGCANLHPPKPEEMDQRIEDIDAVATQREKDQGGTKPVEVHSGYFLGEVKRVPISKAERMPKAFDEHLVLVDRALTLPEIANKLTRILGYPVSLSPRMYSGEGQKEMLARFMEINFSGSVSQFLDTMCAYFGTYWEFLDGAVHVFRQKTVTYTIIASVGEINIKNVISNESSTGSTAGSSSTESISDTSTEGAQKTELVAKMNVWEDVRANISTMLTPGSGSVVVNTSSGTVSVTDSPPVLHQVSEYIESINRRLGRQCAISIKVLTYTVSGESSHGVNLSAVFESLDQSLGITLANANPFTKVSGAGELSASILSNPESGQLRQWSGSEALMKALARSGKVSLVTSGGGITLNNQPMPIEVVRRVSYLKETSITLTSDVGSTSELTPGQVTTGFTLSAVPHILDGNKVLLQYNVTLSSLDDLTEISSGNQKIQVPEVSTRSFLQRVGMKMGQTLVIAGFEEASGLHKDGQGLLSMFRETDNSRTKIIVLIDVNDVESVY
jgi:type IVB pilus formation R64 PilN family outer membrane protein